MQKRSRSWLSTYPETTIASTSSTRIDVKSTRWFLIARFIDYFLPGSLLAKRTPRPCCLAWDSTCESASRPALRARSAAPGALRLVWICCGPAPTGAERSVIGAWVSHGVFGISGGRETGTLEPSPLGCGVGVTG